MSPWNRDTPDTSPPSSDAGSPKLQAKQADDSGRISPVEGSLDGQPRFGVVRSICFVGAGFVGISLPIPAVWDPLRLTC